MLSSHQRGLHEEAANRKEKENDATKLRIEAEDRINGYSLDRDASAAFEKAQNDDASRMSQYQVPVHLETSFTPQEVEDLSYLFEELDADHSGAIDATELKVIFEKMEEEVTEERLAKMISDVDDDGSGEIEFAEFLELFLRFQQGESKFSKVAGLFSKMSETPLAVLQGECHTRKLNLSFKLVEARAATSMHAEVFVMAAVMDGEWREVVDGTIVVTNEKRTYEGIGKTTRDAKFKAATNAISKLKKHIPGMDYPPGEIPPKWLTWFETNVDNGIDEIELLKILTAKGFQPCKNLSMMQKLSLRVSLTQLNEREGGLWPSNKGKDIPPEWIHWAEEHMSKGVAGHVILKVFVEYGFRPDRNPLLTQSFTKRRVKLDPSLSTQQHPGGGRLLGEKLAVSSSSTGDFWSAADDNNVSVMKRYVAGGQDVSEMKMINGYATSALTLATKKSHYEAVELLMELGDSNVNNGDKYGRTPLHHAAIAGCRPIVELLVANNAHIHVVDRYGDTPLIVAAAAGRHNVAQFLLELQGERTRRIVSGKDVVQGQGTFEIDIKAIHDEFIQERLSPYTMQEFNKDWLCDCVMRYFSDHHNHPFRDDVHSEYEQTLKDGITAEYGVHCPFVTDFVQYVDPRKVCTLAKPSKDLVQFVLERFDVAPSRKVLDLDELIFLVNRCFTDSYVNVANRMGRSPLMQACDPQHVDLSDEHLTTLLYLLDDFGCSTQVKDRYKQTALDLLKSNMIKTIGFDVMEDLDQQTRDVEATMKLDTEPCSNDWLLHKLRALNELLAQWRNFVACSEEWRRKGRFIEYREKPRGRLFYMERDPVTGAENFTWAKPMTFIDDDTVRYGWAKIKSDSILVSFIGDWEKHMHSGGQVYYRNLTSKRYVWKGPPVFANNAQLVLRESEKDGEKNDGVKNDVEPNVIVFEEIDELENDNTIDSTDKQKEEETEEQVQVDIVESHDENDDDDDQDYLQDTLKIQGHARDKVCINSAEDLELADKELKDWAESDELEALSLGALTALREACLFGWISILARSECIHRSRGWKQFMDNHTGLTFYLHATTRNIQWFAPNGWQAAHEVDVNDVKSTRIRRLSSHERMRIVDVAFKSLKYDDNSQVRSWATFCDSEQEIAVGSIELAATRDLLRRARVVRRCAYWLEVFDEESGAVLYVDSQNGRTRWYKPKLIIYIDTIQFAWEILRSESRLIQTQEGWQCFLHDEKYIFFYNLETNQTQRVRPRGKMFDQIPSWLTVINPPVDTDIETSEVRAEIAAAAAVQFKMLSLAVARHETVTSSILGKIIGKMDGDQKGKIEDADTEGQEEKEENDAEEEGGETAQLIKDRSDSKTEANDEEVKASAIFNDIEQMSVSQSWHLLRHRIVGFTIWWHSETNQLQMFKPNELVSQDAEKRAWEHYYYNSELVCSIRSLSKHRLKFSSNNNNNSNNQVFFRHTTTGKFTFERPAQWSALADSTDVVPENVSLNWPDMLATGEKVRMFMDSRFVEVRERLTGCTFYFDKMSNQGSWHTPTEVMFLEQKYLMWIALRGREGGRLRKRLKVLRQQHVDKQGRACDDLKTCAGIWREETDKFTDGYDMYVYYVYEDERDQDNNMAQGIPPEGVFDNASLNDASSDTGTSIQIADGGFKSNNQRRPSIDSSARPRRPSLTSGAQGARPRRPSLTGGADHQVVVQQAANQLSNPKQNSVDTRMSLMSKSDQKRARKYRNVALWLDAAEERWFGGCILCTWGCKQWIEPTGAQEHQDLQCVKRQVQCKLHCGLVLRAEQWETAQERHEQQECPKRLVPCDQGCPDQVVFDQMATHMKVTCLKRPVPAVVCGLEEAAEEKGGCSWSVTGGFGDVEEMAWEKEQHEAETCVLRTVRCDYPGCMAEMEARQRAEHRQQHLYALGVSTWTTAGRYKWQVPRKCQKVLIQIWGGGGGGGMLLGRRGGEGGGGAFLQAELTVNPMEELTLVVGGGGSAGVQGVLKKLTKEEMKAQEASGQESYVDGVVCEPGIARGGEPGGGYGMSTNSVFACGGGGGYSAVMRQGPFGKVLLALASAGGGGGSRPGCPGGGRVGCETVDHDGMQRTGRGGKQDAGGEGGCGGATPGDAYTGGNGAEFGAGGGGGLYGGGGGGFTPGVVGGGGGGSSFLVPELRKSVGDGEEEDEEENEWEQEDRLERETLLTMLPGSCRFPGGHKNSKGVATTEPAATVGQVKLMDIPAATGMGEWDYVGGVAGEGGRASSFEVRKGNAGAIRIRLFGYYENPIPVKKENMVYHSVLKDHKKDDNLRPENRIRVESSPDAHGPTKTKLAEEINTKRRGSQVMTISDLPAELSRYVSPSGFHDDFDSDGGGENDVTFQSLEYPGNNNGEQYALLSNGNKRGEEEKSEDGIENDEDQALPDNLLEQLHVRDDGIWDEGVNNEEEEEGDSGMDGDDDDDDDYDDYSGSGDSANELDSHIIENEQHNVDDFVAE